MIDTTLKILPNVLLIEPDKILSTQAKKYLSSKGYNVQAVADAQSAIVAADKLTPDIVVMEVLLAAHSGIEFLYEFRSYSEWQSVPVVICSRVSRSELMINNKTERDLNIYKFLYKPDTSLDKLFNCLDKILAIKIDNKL